MSEYNNAYDYEEDEFDLDLDPSFDMFDQDAVENGDVDWADPEEDGISMKDFLDEYFDDPYDEYGHYIYDEKKAFNVKSQSNKVVKATQDTQAIALYVEKVHNATSRIVFNDDIDERKDRGDIRHEELRNIIFKGNPIAPDFIESLKKNKNVFSHLELLIDEVYDDYDLYDTDIVLNTIKLLLALLPREYLSGVFIENASSKRHLRLLRSVEELCEAAILHGKDDTHFLRNSFYILYCSVLHDPTDIGRVQRLYNRYVHLKDKGEDFNDVVDNQMAIYHESLK